MLSSIVALVVSFGSVYYSTQIGKRLQKEQQKFEKALWVQTALQEANATVVKNHTKVNGIVNVASMMGTRLSEKDIGQLVRLFVETKDIYTGIRHHFDSDAQSNIEKATGEVNRLAKYVAKDIVENKMWITVTQEEYTSTITAYTKLVSEKINKKLETAALD